MKHTWITRYDQFKSSTKTDNRWSNQYRRS